MGFFAYMLRCADGSFYLGHTDDLERRIAQHRDGTLTCYTTKRRPVVLVWVQEFVMREEALAAERQIKGWSRKKKLALIDGDWEAIRRLAWGHRNPLPPELQGCGVHPSIPQGERFEGSAALGKNSEAKGEGKKDGAAEGKGHTTIHPGLAK